MVGRLSIAKGAGVVPELQLTKQNRISKTYLKPMKKQHYNIHLNNVTEEQLNEAPAIVREVYTALKNNQPVDNAKKKIAVQYHDFFNLIPVDQPSFSQAYKRVANVKEFIRSKQKKIKKQKPSPGTIQIEGTAGPEAAEGLKKLVG
jgi:hypothetical protein